MEELTPKAAGLLLFAVILVVPVATLFLSALLLWLYRRAVARQMDASAGSGEPAAVVTVSPEGENSSCADSSALYQQALRGPRRLAVSYMLAGLAFALVFTVAGQTVYPNALGEPGFLLGIWFYVWPVVLALVLVVPASWRLQLVFGAGYFIVLLLLVFWAGTILDIPASNFGAVTLPARSSATPAGTLGLWLIIDGIPTLLVLLCFNRWVRAVAPLVLGFVATAVCGLIAMYLALISKQGIEIVVSLTVLLKTHVAWPLLAAAFVALGVFGAVGWALSRWIARAYVQKRLSDQSLMLDALWLLFTGFYTMWLVTGGMLWLLTAPVAFAAYKIVLITLRVPSPQKSQGLTFLRVFSLGRRSERMLDAVAGYWRHIGSVQMITGPDVAHSTVQPHQFLDFLSRRLSAHFVRDAESLERSLAGTDRGADPDGRFRVNSFFCHEDTWQRVLPRLVAQDEVVLMDLRSFSESNAGCIHELEHLIGNVPLSRCALVVDHTTDATFLEQTLQRVWQDLPADSPNRHRSVEEFRLHRFDASPGAVRQLVRQLCNAD